jgi:excisionase family DNA binding protein
MSSMTVSDPGDSFLTVAEVAATLKLNQQTVRNWIDQGSLPAVRVGRRVRIRRSDFERLLAEGYMAGAGAVRQESGPSAEDFWSGEPVGVAEPARVGDGLTAGSGESLPDQPGDGLPADAPEP